MSRAEQLMQEETRAYQDGWRNEWRELVALRTRVAELEVVLRAAIAVCDAHKDKSMWEYHGSIDALTDACSPMRDVPSAGPAQYATGTDSRCPTCKGMSTYCPECNPDPRASARQGNR